MIDLRLGRWQDVLADVTEVDAVICDPPYSPRVHEGQRSGSRPLGGGGRKSTITYGHLSEAEALAFAKSWAVRTKWWSIVFSDHLGSRWWESAWHAVGWYVFAPVIWLRRNATPRLSGDGPTSACDYITVSRPRHRIPSARCASRPGHYIFPGNDGREIDHPGAKPVGPMRALVRDYTEPGDLIVDPFAGSGTTLLAAAIEGRRAIGAEMDPVTHAKAMRRLAAGYTPAFDFGEVADG